MLASFSGGAANDAGVVHNDVPTGLLEGRARIDRIGIMVSTRCERAQYISASRGATMHSGSCSAQDTRTLRRHESTCERRRTWRPASGRYFPLSPKELLARPAAGARRVSASVSAFSVDKLTAALGIKPFMARHRGFVAETQAFGLGRAARFESPDTSAPCVVDRPFDDAKEATKDDARQRGVSASAPATTDDAIRSAAKVAIDAGDLNRAHALLDLLELKREPASVLTLATRNAARRST
jgi:hypothetical protein